MGKSPPPEDFDDNPDWTDETEARARPASEVHPPHVVAALVKRGRGRPAGSNRERVGIRLREDVLEPFRSEGPGWQTRINATLDMIADIRAELTQLAQDAEASGDEKTARQLRRGIGVLRGNHAAETRNLIRNLAIYVGALQEP